MVGKFQKESIKEVIKQSFKLWRSSLSISIAYLINSLIGLILMASGIGVMAWRLIEYVPTNLTTESKTLTDKELLQELLDGLVVGFTSDYNWLIFIITTLSTVIIIILINTFITAGITGMCKEANEKGETGFSDLFKYAKRKFLNLFAGYIIYYIIASIIIAITTVIFGIFSVYLNDLLSKTNFIHSNIKMLAIILINFGFSITIGYIIKIFIYPLYATVIEKKDPLKSFKSGLKFIKNNLKDALDLVKKYAFIFGVFGVLMNPLILGINVIGTIAGILFVILSILMVVFISPLFQIAFIRLYMQRTGKYVKRTE